EALAKAGDQGTKPVGAALVRADYAIRIHEERLLATCRIALRSFDAAWQMIPLPIQGLSVLDAKFEGEQEPPRLSRNPKQLDQLVVLLSTPGTKVLVLELSAPLSAAGGDRAAAFQFVNAPLGEMTLTLPAGKRLRVDGLLLERPAPDDKPADYRVAIGGRAETRLIITDRKAIDRTDAMTFASTAFGVLASPGEATWTARTQLSVFGRPLDKLECEVPSSLEITDVESQGLEAWQLSDGAPGKTRISLTWRQPFDGLRPITFRGVFSPGRDGRWRVPNLTLHNVSSHTGALVLERPSGVRLQVTQTSGIRPVAADEKAASASGHPASRFEIWKEDFALEFIPAAKEREVQAAMSTLVSLGAQGADLMTTVDLETRFAPLFEADILVPAAWQVLEATHKGERANWQLSPDQAGRNRIRIPLNPPLNPGENRTINLTAHYEPEGWPVGATPIRLALPEVRLPQAGVVEALYGVTADADLDVIPIEIVGLTPARQSDVNTLNQQLAAFHRTVRLGFTYQDTAFTGQLEVRRLPARLTATCVTLTRIDAEEIASHVEAQLVIGGGGVRELTVQLPEAVGRDLRFSVSWLRPRPLFTTPTNPPASVQEVELLLPPLPVILEQKPGTAANGRIPWTIKFDRYASGAFVLQAELSQARAIAGPGQAQQWAAPAIVIVGADRESGAVGIEAADDQYVQVDARDAAGQPMEPVDPIDFPPAHVQPRERLVAAFAYDRPGWTVTVSETRLERIPMPTAVIHKLALASIVGVEGVKQIQADATFSAVGVQSIVIRLPANHTLWGALLDGTPVQVHKSGEALSLPLLPVDPPSRARAVRLIYAPVEPRAGITKHLGGFELNETPPAFLVVTGQGNEQPLTVLASEWTVHHSADLDLVRTTGVFHPSMPLERDSLLHRLMSLFRIPQTDDAIWRIAVLGAVFVVLWLFIVAQRKIPRVLLGCLLVLIAVPVLGLVLVTGTSSTMKFASRFEAPTSSTPPSRPNGPMGGPVGQFDDAVSNLAMDAPKAPAKPGAVDFFDLDTDGTARFMRDKQSAESELERLEERQDGAIERKSHAPSTAIPADPMFGESRAKQNATTAPSYAPPLPAAEPAAPLAAAKPQAKDSGPGALGTSEGLVAGRGFIRGEGLLSVAFGLEPPSGSSSNVLQSTSDDVNSAHAPLSLRFMETGARNLWTCLAAIVVMLAGWWLRKAGIVMRLLFLLTTLLGPISMRWLLPLSWLPIADGVWLGGMATMALWLIRGVVMAICDCPCLSRWCKPHSNVTAALMLIAAFSVATTASAQEAAPAKPLATPAPETVFVPYDNPREPLSAKNVFVPQDLFLKLWRAAHPDDAPPVKPPLPAVVSAAAFVVDLTKLPEDKPADGRSLPLAAPVTARLILNNLTSPATRLALPVHGIAIRSATLNGSPAILDSQRGNALLVTLLKPGVSILDLEFDAMVYRTGPAGKLHWENAAVPAGILGLKLPKAGPPLEVRVGGSVVSAKTPAEGNELVFEIPIDRGGAQDVSWQPAASKSGADSP
ncbi:MAG TPA: hypothetical protein VM510_04830, partial [Caulifigura sp.]|nr:hypothetical protein [Caulifigura sp.]